MEAYYQHLYDVPIEGLPNSTHSLINTFDIWDIIGTENANNDGFGRNIGVDITLEKFFSNQYYFLITGSLYDSKFKAADGKWHNTRFNGNYQLNLLYGKEFKMGQGGKNIFGVNGKFVLSGGNRFTPINLDASAREGYTIRYLDRPFESRAGAYYRWDLGVSYRINGNKTSHTILLQAQNVTNRLNVYSLYFDGLYQKSRTGRPDGIVPGI